MQLGRVFLLAFPSLTANAEKPAAVVASWKGESSESQLVAQVGRRTRGLMFSRRVTSLIKQNSRTAATQDQLHAFPHETQEK